MRVIVYGAGAIGGVVAAALALAGREVVAIARGPRLEAIRSGGLLLRTPRGENRAPLEAVGDPSEIAFRPGDAVMLAMKTQHTEAALERLRAAGWRDGPIFCAQNGVANEAMALRRFPNVHGVVVMMPASYMAADEANVFAGPRHGVFDLGRYPSGVDADDERMASALDDAGVAAFTSPEVMAGKYGKLLLNLNNIAAAAFGRDPAAAWLKDALRAEGEAALAAAGVAWRDVGAADPRREALMKMAEIPGVGPFGNSTAQSIARGAGSVETDYLNGEIALLARAHGVAAPLNAAVCALGAALARGETPDLAAALRDLRVLAPA